MTSITLRLAALLHGVAQPPPPGRLVHDAPLIPGDGELPLREFVRGVPPDIIVSLEIPMRTLAEKGVGPRERLMPP